MAQIYNIKLDENNIEHCDLIMLIEGIELNWFNTSIDGVNEYKNDIEDVFIVMTDEELYYNQQSWIDDLNFIDAIYQEKTLNVAKIS